jgi:hypothetical protein
MAAIASTPNAIDRKLHRIVLDSNPDEFKSFAALARYIARSKPAEFSYQRLGKPEYAGADAIESYVSVSRDIGLLDGDLRTNRPKKEIRTLENFQQWLSDLTMQYLEAKNASLKQIEQAILGLSQNSPCRLPTQENIRTQLQNPPSSRNFRLALKIVALLRSNVISVTSRRLVLMDGIIED